MHLYHVPESLPPDTKMAGGQLPMCGSVCVWLRLDDVTYDKTHRAEQRIHACATSCRPSLFLVEDSLVFSVHAFIIFVRAFFEFELYCC